MKQMLSREPVALLVFAAVILLMPIWLTPFGANYPDLLQKFAIFAIFAMGFNILFGLTGYLSFGHAAFLGVGSYAAVWSFKLFTMNVIPAIMFGIVISGLFALLIGYVSLRRSGIYFSILTLAFAQMSYNLAYSVLTPITNGETGLQLTLQDPRIIDRLFSPAGDGLPSTTLFGLSMSGYSGFYFCAAMLIICFFVTRRIFKSPFGLMLLGIKSNQNRMGYTGFNTRPYTLTAFVISGMFAGLAGSLLAVTDPLAGAERMQWTASGEVVLMTILGGVGTLIGPMLGAWIIKYFENIFSAFNEATLEHFFSFLPDGLRDLAVSFSSLFVGEGWHLTLGVLFMMIVIFLPGGIMEGWRRLVRRAGGGGGGKAEPAMVAQAAEQEDGTMVANSVLHVADVHKNFGGLRALSDVDLNVTEGEIHAIIGPNGAGKSTLLNVCVGRIKPDSGHVVFNGETLDEHTPYQINQLGVSRVFQTPEIFPDLSLLDNVMIPAFAKRDGAFKLQPFTKLRHQSAIRDEAEQTLGEVGLADLKDREAGSLSRGDKRRLELAMCLIQHPKLLLLDEPTAGMSRHDTNRTVDLLKTIKERGMTKVIIEHDMHVVFSLADRISVLAQGRIIASGRPDEIKGNPKVQEAYLGGAH